MKAILLFAIVGLIVAYDEHLAQRASAMSMSLYCPKENLQDWSCKTCKKYAPGFQMLKVINEDVSEMLGAIGYDPKLDKLVLGYRGSNNLMNWIEDFCAWKAPPEDSKDFPGSKIHAGFLTTYHAVQNHTIMAIKGAMRMYPGKPLVITGHSLGAAIATLAAADVVRNHNIPVHSVMLFGSPRVGDEGFDKLYESLKINTIRVVHRNDPVTRAPMKWLDYHHIPQEVFYPTADEKSFQVCDNIGEDPKCSVKDPMNLLYVLDHGCYLGVPALCWGDCPGLIPN